MGHRDESLVARAVGSDVREYFRREKIDGLMHVHLHPNPREDSGGLLFEPTELRRGSVPSTQHLSSAKDPTSVLERLLTSVNQDCESGEGGPSRARETIHPVPLLSLSSVSGVRSDWEIVDTRSRDSISSGLGSWGGA